MTHRRAFTMVKKLSLIFIAFIFLLLTVGHSEAVNTINFLSHIIEISSIDSDWDFEDTFGVGASRLNIISIQFVPGAADDQCVIKDTSDTGPAFFDVTSYDTQYDLFKTFDSPNAGFKPYLDYSDGTYSTGAKVIIILGQ